MRAEELVLRISDGYKPTDEERRFLSVVSELYLRRTTITSLEGLSGLTYLESLDLSGTRVSSLEGLSGLTYLQKLWLNETQVSSLEGLSGLTYLQKLWLNETQVSSLEGLSGLTNLQALYLSNTQVSSLEGLSGLTNLQALDLRYTKVSSLEGLSGLTNLQALYLSNTQVSSLEGLSGLTNLQALWLNETKITSLEAIASLPNLNYLCVSKTSLDHIPRQFVDKGFRFITDDDSRITENAVYMQDVQLSEQPVSLFSQPRKLIKAYFNEEQIPVNEAKVIFLGDGGVGKTYTIYRIEHNGKEPDKTVTTPGVSITPFHRPNKATINFWDFGGQEIMHSMHRCFLTERTCYVVTVSNRWSEVTRQARRWLKNVESFAPNSKVILAVNRWDGVSVWDLDRKKLKEEFPNLLDVIEYTATDSGEIQILKNRIEEEVDKLHSVNMTFPKSWSEIMGSLRNMTDDSGKPSNYISKEKYQRICENAKLKTVGDISVWLLEWFNDLGVCFSYHREAKNRPILADYMILKPEWLTNAVYIIVNNGRKFAQQGRITHEGMLDILNKPEKYVVKGLSYSEEELKYILEVMRKFRLSFKIGDDLEFVPALCPNVTPNKLHPDIFEKHVRCEVRYDYLPDSVVHRLMCDFSGRLNFDKCWLKGLCVDERVACGLYAVCDMGKDDDVLLIDVYQIKGDDKKSGAMTPQSLLRKLLNKLEKINDELNLKSTPWICSEDGKAAFELSFLLDAVQQKMGESLQTLTENASNIIFKNF